MDIKQRALHWIEEHIDNENWPEDEWTSLTDDFDLNIYVDDDGNNKATVFPVVDGETDLERFIEIY